MSFAWRKGGVRIVTRHPSHFAHTVPELEISHLDLSSLSVQNHARRLTCGCPARSSAGHLHQRF
jgi:hypothetical protein